VGLADKEYFYHSAKLQLRFRELLKLIKDELQPAMPLGSCSHQSQSSFLNITSWFHTQQQDDTSEPIISICLQKRVKTCLKHFEICGRILEQVVVKTLEVTY